MRTEMNTIPKEYIRMGNHAPGFAAFLQGRQLTFWRDILFHVRENCRHRQTVGSDREEIQDVDRNPDGPDGF